MDAISRMRPKSGWLIPVLLLLMLFAVTVALWVASTMLSDPASSTDGRPKTEGFTHYSSLYGQGADRLHRPTEVDTDRQGNLYVVDSFKHRILVFNADGDYVRTIGSPANVDGALRYPSAVEIDDRGRVYVNTSEPDGIVIFEASGRVFKRFDVPRPLTMDVQGERLYVATDKGILIGDLDGNQVGQMLSHGAGKGQIDRPTGLVVDQDGTMYIADSMNYRFQAIGKDGKVKWVLGKGVEDKAKAPVDKSRDFGLPAGLTLGSDGVLYAIDAFNGEIVAISTDGERKATFGAWGRKDGEFYYPTGIVELDAERFAVADTFNDRVQIIGVPSPAPGPVTLGKRGLPWLVPVLLLLGLFFLLRRPVGVVADAAGIRRAADRGLLGDLMTTAKQLYVPLGTADVLPELLAADERLIDVLREVDMGESEGSRDPVCDIALALRGRWGLRRVAIAFPSAEQADFAETERLGVIGEVVDGTTAVAPA